jgi:hypothetical protein
MNWAMGADELVLRGGVVEKIWRRVRKGSSKLGTTNAVNLEVFK